MTAAVREIELPPGARAHSTLARIDYTDAFLVDAPVAAAQTPERWARRMLQASPAVMRGALPVGWFVLGLKLGSPRSRERVLGWEVRQSTADVALLGGTSRTGMPAELLFERCEDGMLFATLVGFENPVVRALWAGIAAPHRQVVRYLLGQASHG